MDEIFRPEIFVEDSLKEIQILFESEVDSNEYVSKCLELIKTATPKEIAEYGISKVGPHEDHKLASYFFILSNMKIFSPTARDFFTDVMVYCEDQLGPLRSATTVAEKFEKEIRPML